MKKLINLLMIAGKKNTAQKIFCAAGLQFMQSIRKKGAPLKKVKPNDFKDNTHDFHHEGQTNTNLFVQQLHEAIRNVQPSLEGKKRRVGRATRLVPAVVPPQRGESLALRWMVESAKRRKRTNSLSFSQCLAQEFLDAYKKEGQPRQRRDQFHKVCEANRGFLRYRWW